MSLPAASAALPAQAAAAAHDPALPELSGALPHAAHGAALAMLAVIFLTLGLVAAFGLHLHRRGRAMRPTQLLLDSLRDTPAPPPAANADARWEKPADWWKR